MNCNDRILAALAATPREPMLHRIERLVPLLAARVAVLAVPVAALWLAGLVQWGPVR